MPIETAAMERTLTRRYRITVEQYHRMAEAGILPEDVRVELIDGEILAMSAIGPRHAGCANRLVNAFAPLLGKALLSVQNPLALSDDAEPVPDFMVLRPRADAYAQHHPAPADVHLLIEVFDTADRADLERKRCRLAERRVREYWVVDVGADLVEVCRSPRGGRWGEARLFGRGESVAPLAFPDFPVEVDAILPAA